VFGSNVTCTSMTPSAPYQSRRYSADNVFARQMSPRRYSEGDATLKFPNECLVAEKSPEFIKSRIRDVILFQDNMMERQKTRVQVHARNMGCEVPRETVFPLSCVDSLMFRLGWGGCDGISLKTLERFRALGVRIFLCSSERLHKAEQMLDSSGLGMEVVVVAAPYDDKRELVIPGDKTPVLITGLHAEDCAKAVSVVQGATNHFVLFWGSQPCDERALSVAAVAAFPRSANLLMGKVRSAVVAQDNSLGSVCHAMALSRDRRERAACCVVH